MSWGHFGCDSGSCFLQALMARCSDDLVSPLRLAITESDPSPVMISNTPTRK